MGRLMQALHELTRPADLPPRLPSSDANRQERRRMKETETAMMLEAAKSRPPLEVERLRALAEEMKRFHPLRAARFQKDLNWIIKQGHKRGFRWEL